MAVDDSKFTYAPCPCYLEGALETNCQRQHVSSHHIRIETTDGDCMFQRSSGKHLRC